MESSRSIKAKSLSTKRALYPSEAVSRGSEKHVQKNKNPSRERMQMLQSLNGDNDTSREAQNVNFNGDVSLEAINQLNHEDASDSSDGSSNLGTSQLIRNESEQPL